MSFDPQYGKKSVFKRNIFQAVLSKCLNKTQTESFSRDLKSLDVKCIWVCIASRTADNEYLYEEEEGASAKLISILKRMSVTNVIIGVRLWPDGSLPQHDIYRMVINCSKDLLIDYLAPAPEVREQPRLRKANIIELDTLPNESKRNISFDSINRSSPSVVPISKAKNRISNILSKIKESDIKALHGFINHAVVGKLLIVLLVLLQRQKPNLSLAKQFFSQNNIKLLMGQIDPTSLTKYQVARASKMMKKLSEYPPGYFEKISKPALYIFEFLKAVLNSENSLISLPSVQKSLLVSKGEYVKSKYMVFNKVKEITPEEIPVIKESTPTPEPDALEQLKKLSPQKKNNLSEDEGEADGEEGDQVLVDDKFKQARKNRLEEEELISRLVNLNPDDIDPEVKIDFSLTDEDVIKFLGTEDLESQPTDLLLQLAARLKERREHHSLG